MNKNITINAFTLIFIATSIQTLKCHTVNNPPSVWQYVVTFFVRNSEQPQNNTNQAPADVTADDYIDQFYYDLNGNRHPHKIPLIPWDEMHMMEGAIRKELNSVNLRDKDTVNQIIRSVLINHVKEQTIQQLAENIHTDVPLQGYYVTHADIESISTTMENNILARLNRIPHLSGETLAEFFGEARRNAIRKAFYDRKNNGN